MRNVYGRRIEVENRARRKARTRYEDDTTITKKIRPWRSSTKKIPNTEERSRTKKTKWRERKSRYRFLMDYSMWKKRITIYLKMKKCDEVIIREKVAADKCGRKEKVLRPCETQISIFFKSTFKRLFGKR